MQSHCLGACSNLALPQAPLPGFCCRRHCWNPLASLPFSLPDDASGLSTALSVFCAFPSAGRRTRGGREEPVRDRKKENVWSVDNDLAAAKASAGEKTCKHRRRRGRRVRSANKRGPGDKVLVSGSMLMKIETVLQTQARELQLLVLNDY